MQLRRTYSHSCNSHIVLKPLSSRGRFSLSPPSSVAQCVDGIVASFRLLITAAGRQHRLHPPRMVRIRSKSSDGLPVRLAPTISSQETLSEPTEYHLPAEVISHIISYFVVDGLKISIDPSHESDMATIHALLATNLEIKRETLRQIYNQPLTINIVNGACCGCSKEALHDSNIHKMSIVNKIMEVPLDNWPKIGVHFIPKMKTNMCDITDNKITSKIDPMGMQFDLAMKCIARQSDALARFVRFQYHPTQRYFRDVLDGSGGRDMLTTLTLRYNPKPEDAFEAPRRCYLNLAFFFDDDDEIRSAGMNRGVPLWAWLIIVELLEHWFWSSRVGGCDQIRLPASMSTAFRHLYDDGTIRTFFPSNPQGLADYFQTLFWQWWRPGLQLDKPEISLANINQTCPSRSTFQFFPNPNPTLPLPFDRRWTFCGIGVLRVSVSRGEDGVESWKGELLAMERLPLEAVCFDLE